MLLALDHLHSNGFLYRCALRSLPGAPLIVPLCTWRHSTDDTAPRALRRDLKPENVMVNETTGHIKLVDFDLVVRDCDAVTPLSLVVSPPAAAASCGGGSGNGRASPCSPLLVGGGCGVTGPFSFDDAAIAASECFGTPPLEILKDLSPRVSGRLKVPSSVAGTAEYIAPELLAGCPCSPASDRWQVGVVLHEMLFGVSPFRGSRPQTTFLLIATARVELPEAAEARTKLMCMR